MVYVVRESDRCNVDMEVLAAEGYAPGPWLKQVKDSSIPVETEIEVAGANRRIGDLRNRLLVHQPGDSIAYLTDFCLESEQKEEELVRLLTGCRVLVCENNFRDGDAELARKSYHMTSADVGKLAARIGPERLVVFHLSDRYTQDEWREQLEEVRTHFAGAIFPEEWRLT
jgi:ribonuclease Z